MINRARAGRARAKVDGGTPPSPGRSTGTDPVEHTIGMRTPVWALPEADGGQGPTSREPSGFADATPLNPRLEREAMDTEAKAVTKLTLVAHEDHCDDRKMCFHTSEDEAPTIHAGEQVVVTLENEGTQEHDVHVAPGTHADENHENTPTGEALGGTDPVGPGKTASVDVAVPEVTTLYVWCSVGDHESHGMWMELPVTAEVEAR